MAVHDEVIAANDAYAASFDKGDLAMPPARAFAGMSYDGARGVTVIFGGEGNSGALLGDTWEWDGSEWSQSATSAAPTPRRGVAMGIARCSHKCCAPWSRARDRSARNSHSRRFR